MSHECAEIVVYCDKLMLPKKCVCLEPDCGSATAAVPLSQSLGGNVLSSASAAVVLAKRLAPTSLLYDLVRDYDLTKILIKETVPCLVDKRLFTAHRQHVIRTALAPARCVGPSAWQRTVERCRKVPHLRKHISPSDTTYLHVAGNDTGVESATQAYMGGVVLLNSFVVVFDPDRRCDVARANVMLPLSVTGGEIFYDLDVCLALSGDALLAAQALLKVDAADGAAWRFGSVSIDIGDTQFEKVPLVCGDNGLRCRLLQAGLPFHAFAYAKVSLSCDVFISPALDAPALTPTSVRYRCSVVTFRDRAERDALAEAPICLTSGVDEQSPWLIRNGLIAKVLPHCNGAACVPQTDCDRNSIHYGCFREKPSRKNMCCDDDKGNSDDDDCDDSDKD